MKRTEWSALEAGLLILGFFITAIIVGYMQSFAKQLGPHSRLLFREGFLAGD